MSAHEPGPWTELVDGFRNPSVTPKYLILIVAFEKPTPTASPIAESK